VKSDEMGMEVTMRKQSYSKGNKRPWRSDYEKRYFRQALAQGALLLIMYFVVMLIAFTMLQK